MPRGYDRTKDVPILKFPPATLDDGRIVKAEVFSYDGGSPKLRVRIGPRIALKADRGSLVKLLDIISEAVLAWPKETR